MVFIIWFPLQLALSLEIRYSSYLIQVLINIPNLIGQSLSDWLRDSCYTYCLKSVKDVFTSDISEVLSYACNGRSFVLLSSSVLPYEIFICRLAYFQTNQ